MRVSIFGMGYVGAVTGACLAELGHEVVGVDPQPGKLNLINAGRSPVVEAGVEERIKAAVDAGRLRATDDPGDAVAATDLSLVAVGTPSSSTGAPALDALDRVLADIGGAIARKDKPHAVVVRSTVLPGTTESRLKPALVEHSGRDLGQGLQVCYNPEFLREGSAVKDFHNPPFTVAGSDSEQGQDLLAELYSDVPAPVVRTNCTIAESVKYLSNAYHALKVVFANEAGTLLKGLGIDSREAMDIFCQDRDLNISAAYLRPGFAFGGSCLPKELRGLQSMARSRHVELPVMSQILASNQRHIDNAFDMIVRHGRQKIALFGLSFKPGTDDLRESPLVLLAEKLIGKGYDLKIVDQNVEFARLVGSNREYIDREIPHLERLLVSDPSEALQDCKVIVVGHVGEAEIEAIAAHHHGRAVIDLAGVKAIEELSGIAYEGICW